MLAVIILAPIRSTVADWYDVPSGSMEPTILPGDRIFVNKLSYGLRLPFTYYWLARWDEPKPGEIIICHRPDDDTRLVKRLIGKPGDTIELKLDHLYLNGKMCDYGELSQADKDSIEDSLRTTRLPNGQASSNFFSKETVNGREHIMMLRPGMFAIRSYGPITLKEDEYFVMGDNRDQSLDSRRYQVQTNFNSPMTPMFIKKDMIVGRSSAVAFSLDRDNWYVPRIGRFFHGLN